MTDSRVDQQGRESLFDALCVCGASPARKLTYHSAGCLEHMCETLSDRLDETADVARAAISWTQGELKIRLCERLEKALNG